MTAVKTFDASSWPSFEPVPAEKVQEGSPTTRIYEAARTEKFISGLWQVTAGRFDTAPTGYDEIVHILSGRGVLRSSAGVEVKLEAGVKFVLPEGFTGEWDIHEPLEKLFVQVLTAAV